MRRTLLLTAMVFAVAVPPAAASAPVREPEPAGLQARRRPALAHDAGGEGRPDDADRAPPVRAGRRQPRPQRDADHHPRARLGPVRRRLHPRGGQHPAGVGRHGRQVPARGAQDAAEDPAALRRGLRARPRQPARRHRLPAQHRPGRHARSRPRAPDRGDHRARRRARAARSGRSRPASAPPATTAGAAPTRVQRGRAAGRALRDRDRRLPGRRRARDRQALRR